MSQPAKRARMERRMDNDDDEGYEPSSSQPTPSSRRALPVVADSEQMSRLVKDVIRYILACEYKNILIRKDDINKKVLHEYSRQYNAIFKEAKEELLYTFGMGLLEIPAKDIKGRNNNKAIAASVASQQQQQQATQQQGKAAPSSHTYILYNSLNKDLEAYQVIHQSDEDYASMGLLYYILSMILVNEQELLERELYGCLAKVGVENGSDTFGDLEKMLALYMKQGYLHRYKGTLEEESTYQWGPRAKSEISYKDLASFMSSICSPENEDEFKQGVFKSAGF